MTTKVFKNNKTGLLYEVDMTPVSNSTNDVDGQVMLLYWPLGTVNGVRYVREVLEFQDKFTESDIITRS